MSGYDMEFMMFGREIRDLLIEIRDILREEQASLSEFMGIRDWHGDTWS